MAHPTAPQTYSSTFPASPPPDLDRPDIIAAHDQAAFHSLDRLLRHWDRPHRPSYHCLIPFGEQPAAVELAARCQAYLPGTGLDLIPPKWLHLTIRRIGYEDEIEPGQLDELAIRIGEAVSGHGRFTLQLIPLAGSPGAVRFSVAPWGPILDLYQKVATACGDGELKALDVLRPHVGIAYSAAQQPAKAISVAVSQAAATEQAAEVEIAALSLVRMARRSGTYEWNELVTLPTATCQP